ncbi:MAG: TylF/MycF family methyltransferase [Chloroflexota bacterium]|nr:TylF/MycF family methyltransferase [Chloroflexota bacterium]
MDSKARELERVRDLYLELLIGSLTHTVYAGVDSIEPPVESRAAFARAMIEAGEGSPLFDPERARAEGRDWPLHAQTMVGVERMRNVRRCVELALAEDVPGDLIEAGAWRGGVAILMRGILNAYGVEDRVVWVADSFRGLPAPDPDRYPYPARLPEELEFLAVPVDEVRENFRRYALLDDQVRLVEGWFSETLPSLRGRCWSVVRVDGDMYESTMDSLVNLYDGLSPRGFLIVDDFGLAMCRDAVEDFRRDRGIDEPIEQVDWTGVFWRKGAD